MNNQIDELIEFLLSSDNSLRQQAEQDLKEARKSNGELLLQKLVEYIQNNGNTEQKQPNASLACILLKKFYLDERKEEEGLWNINEQNCQELKNSISQSLNFKVQTKQILQRKAEILCKCFKKLQNFPEFIQNLVAFMNQQDGEQQEIIKRKQFILYSFEILAEYHLSQDLIVQNSQNFIELFKSSLEDSQIEIKVASLKAITSFLSSIDDEEVVLKYKSLTEKLLNVVVEVLKVDEAQGQASLEFMIELTQTHGDIWQGSIPILIFVVSQIMKNREFEDATRSSAIEIVTTLSENMAAILRKHQNELKEHFFPALAYMMTEVDLADDLDAWYEEEETELQTKNDPSNIAAENLQRISVFLGEKTTLLCSSNLIQSAIQSSDWKEQFMGFKYLGMISEACKKQFKQNIQDVAQMSASGLLSQNPRVRYEALQCTGLLLNDLCPQFQEKFHKDLVPALIIMMNTETTLKIQTQAVACMTSFVKGLIDEETAEDSEINQNNKKILIPYSDQIVQSISELFSKSIEKKYKPLQEEVLVTLSCIASVLDTNFESHYHKFMPGLINILQTVQWQTQQEQELRSNCIECMGYILTSVKEKPEICKQDAIQICHMIIQTMTSGNLQDSDPQITAISNTISQICVCIKEDFKQFLPLIVPQLLKDADRDIDFKVKDADDIAPQLEEDDQKEGYQSLQVKVKGLEGAKEVSMNTYALEVKINAIQIIKNIARNIGKAYFDFVEDTAALLLNKSISDPFSFTIRKEAAKCMRFLIAACEEHPQKQKTLFIMSYARMMEELEKRKSKMELDQVNGILKELYKQLQNFYHFKEQSLMVFQVEDAITFLTKLKEIIDIIKKDKEDRKQKVKQLQKQIDEEDLEYFMEDLEKIDKGIHHIMEIVGFLIQNMGSNDQICQFIGQNILPIYAQTLLNISDKKDYELVDSVCMICDCMEHGNDQLFQQINGQASTKFIELIHYAASDKEDLKYDLLQSCIFGLGIIAQRLPLGKYGYLQETLQILNLTCRQEKADIDEDERYSLDMLKDNSISTLAKLVFFQNDGTHTVLKQDLIQELFTSLLPIKNDIDEAQDIHQEFLKLVLEQKKVIVDYQEFAKILIENIKNYAVQNQNDKEKDILGDKGKAILEQILAKI